MKLNKFLILFILLSASLFAGEKTYGDLKFNYSNIVRVYDGDTFFLNLPEYPAIIGDYIGVRCSGYDTCEMTDSKEEKKLQAQKAKEYLVSLLKNAQKLELRNIKRDKYFRILGDLYIDNRNVADLMVSKKLAYYYNGGKKID